MAKFKKVRQSSPSGSRRNQTRGDIRTTSQHRHHPSRSADGFQHNSEPEDIGALQPHPWRSTQLQQENLNHQQNSYGYDTSGGYQHNANAYDSLPASEHSYSNNSRVRFSPPDGYESSESTLIDESTSGYQTVLPEDSASNLINRNYHEEKPYYQANSSNTFLAVPELRQRQTSYVSPGKYPGGFNPNARYSSAVSVASSDREVTSEAWIKRQRIKPGRAKTKKVKLTKGRFIAEFGETSRIQAM